MLGIWGFIFLHKSFGIPLAKGHYPTRMGPVIATTGAETLKL